MARSGSSRFVLIGAAGVALAIAAFNFILPDNSSGPNASPPDPTEGLIEDASAINALGYDYTTWWSGTSDLIQSRNLLETNWVLIFDDSGSMNESQCSNNDAKINVAKQAAVTFVGEIPSADNVAVYLLNGTPVSGTFKFDTRQAALNQIVNSYGDGGTPLGFALREGRELLAQQAARQLGYGTYNLVVLTDGAASDADTMVTETIALFENTPIELHVIGFCLPNQHALNIEGLVRYYNASTPELLDEAFGSILAESGAFDADSATTFDAGS